MREGMNCLLACLSEDLRLKRWRTQWRVSPRVNVAFADLGLVVRGAPILKGVTGEFAAGQMYAVMGEWGVQIGVSGCRIQLDKCKLECRKRSKKAVDE